ncbi:hypothetical protein [Neptunitalea lumnitzerae]|uniref:Uncharacterized protein n=1 Tax=Neptunitalea lumnitzerae TaxID=2965509 RepID=A0ABQ5MH73_9FLAO|nr:hypothetical protein [Neptunitalea sp. Y10]GLB48771.1 hypothetical protein Y10_11390 [Neptunitalea sp. Y10]
MKRLIQIVFFLIIGGVIYGTYTLISGDKVNGDRIMGICVLATSFILMPLFIYHRWKGKDIRNYMLTKENLDKMNDSSGEKNKKH